MGTVTLDNIRVTELKVISLEKGNVLKALKNNDSDYERFGEAYFSFINPLEIKGWKFHKLMKLNLVVPIGNVRFVFFDSEKQLFREEIVGENNYCRLTVPPCIWFAFQGVSSYPSLILNIANIQHDPEESYNKPIDYFNFIWER